MGILQRLWLVVTSHINETPDIIVFSVHLNCLKQELLMCGLYNDDIDLVCYFEN